MLRAYTLVFGSFVATFIVLNVLFGTIKGEFKQSQVAPFNEIVDYFCSKAGTEYLITQNHAVALHVDQAGQPVLCATQEPLVDK